MNKVNLIDIGYNLASSRLLKHVERILDDAEQAGVRRQILTRRETQKWKIALGKENQRKRCSLSTSKKRKSASSISIATLSPRR